MKAWVAELLQQPHSRCELRDFPCHGLYANPGCASLKFFYNMGLAKLLQCKWTMCNTYMNVPGIASAYRARPRTMFLRKAICDLSCRW